MPFDIPTLLVFRHLATRRATQAKARAARQAPLAALRASPVHVILSRPLPHQVVLSSPSPPPHLLPIRVSVPVKTDAGVRHPTPQEVAAQMLGQKTVAQMQALLAQLNAKTAAWLKAHPRPRADAAPSDIAAWLKAGGGSPRAMFPEWKWTVIPKGATPNNALATMFGLTNILNTLYEPGEAIAVVQLGDHDVVTWYEHPSGAWSYYHHWGEDFGEVVASLGSVVANAISDAARAISSAVHDVTNVVSSVLKYAQIAASLVPGLGQVVNEVVTLAETAIDVLEGESAIAIALDSAYHALLASVPGLEALAPFVDPLIDFLKNLADGSMRGMADTAVHSALGAALKNVPDVPSVGSYSPRSIAASFAGWVLSKMGIHA